MTNFFLLRSMRLMTMTLLASLSACFCWAASALAAFFWESFSARFWASTEREAVAASRASAGLLGGCHQETGVPRWGAQEEENGVGGLRTRAEDAPVDQILSYMSGWFFSSHAWHLATVPPYSQYYHASESLSAAGPSRGRRTSGGRVQTTFPPEPNVSTRTGPGERQGRRNRRPRS